MRMAGEKLRRRSDAVLSKSEEHTLLCGNGGAIDLLPTQGGSRRGGLVTCSWTSVFVQEIFDRQRRKEHSSSTTSVILGRPLMTQGCCGGKEAGSVDVSYGVSRKNISLHLLHFFAQVSFAWVACVLTRD